MLSIHVNSNSVSFLDCSNCFIVLLELVRQKVFKSLMLGTWNLPNKIFYGFWVYFSVFFFFFFDILFLFLFLFCFILFTVFFLMFLIGGKMFYNVVLVSAVQSYKSSKFYIYQISNTCWIIEKAREFQKRHLLLLHWLRQSLSLCGSQQTVENS